MESFKAQALIINNHNYLNQAIKFAKYEKNKINNKKIYSEEQSNDNDNKWKWKWETRGETPY